MKRVMTALVVAVLALPGSAERVGTAAEATLEQGLLGTVNVRIRGTQVTESVSVAPGSDAMALFRAAGELVRQKRVNDAIEIYRVLTDSYPGLPEPHNNLGLLYLRSGQYEMAEVAFMGALRIRPGYSAAEENLGDVHARAALRAYDKAAKLEPAFPFAGEKFRHLAPILRKTGSPASVSLSFTP